MFSYLEGYAMLSYIEGYAMLNYIEGYAPDDVSQLKLWAISDIKFLP